MSLKSFITLTILTCLLASQYTFGQQGSRIDSLVIIPLHPTENDEIQLVCYTTFLSGDCVLINHSIDVQENEIDVILEYAVGFLSVICHSEDTLTIGNLSADSYELIANLTTLNSGAIYDMDTINFTVDNVLGINDWILKNDFEIYPNPFSDDLTINATNVADLNYVEIYSVIGNSVFKEEFKKNMSINLSNLSDGFYVIILTDKNGNQYTKKIVKHAQ